MNKKELYAKAVEHRRNSKVKPKKPPSLMNKTELQEYINTSPTSSNIEDTETIRQSRVSKADKARKERDRTKMREKYSLTKKEEKPEPVRFSRGRPKRGEVRPEKEKAETRARLYEQAKTHKAETGKVHNKPLSQMNKGELLSYLGKRDTPHGTLKRIGRPGKKPATRRRVREPKEKTAMTMKAKTTQKRNISVGATKDDEPAIRKSRAKRSNVKPPTRRTEKQKLRSLMADFEKEERKMQPRYATARATKSKVPLSKLQSQFALEEARHEKALKRQKFLKKDREDKRKKFLLKDKLERELKPKAELSRIISEEVKRSKVKARNRMLLRQKHYQQDTAPQSWDDLAESSERQDTRDKIKKRSAEIAHDVDRMNVYGIRSEEDVANLKHYNSLPWLDIGTLQRVKDLHRKI
jgi:hypothetical protein